MWISPNICWNKSRKMPNEVRSELPIALTPWTTFNFTWYVLDGIFLKRVHFISLHPSFFELFFYFSASFLLWVILLAFCSFLFSYKIFFFYCWHSYRRCCCTLVFLLCIKLVVLLFPWVYPLRISLDTNKPFLVYLSIY